MTEPKDRLVMEYTDYEGCTHRVSVCPAATGTEFVDTFRAFLFVCGFHHATVAELLNDPPEEPLNVNFLYAPGSITDA